MFMFLFLFQGSILHFQFASKAFAVESPSIIFREIQPLSTPDSVILECLSETDLSQVTVSDLDGTDTPITSTSTSCEAGETVQLIWDTIIPSETRADHTFLSIDTALTNTKDQIVIQKPDGTLLDAVIYWDGISSFASTTEQSDIDKILTAGLWSGGNSTDALIIEVGKSMQRTNETREKTSWEAGNWEKLSDDEDEDVGITDDDSTEITESDEESDTNQDTDSSSTNDQITDSTDSSNSTENEEENTDTSTNEETNTQENTTTTTSPQTPTLVVSTGNSSNDPIQNIDTTIHHSTNGSKKLQNVMSPQMNYANEPTRWSLPNDYGLYISSILPQSSKKDIVRFYNPTKTEKNLSSYVLYANNKKILMPHTILKPQSFTDAIAELPNTKAKIDLVIEGIQVQHIQYETSKKDEHFTFSKENGLWTWSKTLETPSKIEEIVRAKKESVLGTRTEGEKEKIPSLETHESSGPPGGFPVAEAADVSNQNAPVEILKTNYVWYGVGIGILGLFAVMTPKILRSFQKFLPQETLENPKDLPSQTSEFNNPNVQISDLRSQISSPLDLSSFSIQMKQTESSPYKSEDTSTVASIIGKTIPIQAFG